MLAEAIFSIQIHTAHFTRSLYKNDPDAAIKKKKIINLGEI